MSRKRDGYARKMTVIYHETAYNCEVYSIPTDSLSLDAKPQCPFCGAFLAIVGETYQRGTTQDKGTLRLLCRKHPAFFLYNYHVGNLIPADNERIEADASAAV